jgi:hypothetical protein
VKKSKKEDDEDTKSLDDNDWELES